MFNAKKTIRDCLESLIGQLIDLKEYEIIVVDDGSTDNSAEILKEYPSVRLLRQENSGPASARNKGAEQARGEIILFTDADCIPQSDWVIEMTKPLKDWPEIVGVKGRYKTNQKEIIARFVQAEYEDKYDLMGKQEFIDFIDTYSAAFRRNVFLNMGGYNLNFSAASAEDVELSYRLANKGFKMVFNPNAVVSHKHPANIVSYLKKKFKFAFWRILAVKNNPNRAIKDSHTPQIMKLQVVFIPFIFASLIFSFITRQNHVLFILLLIYLILTIPFSLKAFQKDKVVGLVSPILLFLRSCSQFFGILLGIFNFI